MYGSLPYVLLVEGPSLLLRTFIY
uniref:Uncharacterized protein n=1 Tax=Arundo donax TaxID=35708 RepID=A0A0A9B9P2_ARUDO